MTKTIYILCLAIILLVNNVSCQQKPSYQAVINDRAQRDTTLSYSGIYLGDPIAKYGSTDKVIIDIKDAYISLPDAEIGDHTMEIVGDIPTHISIEQCNRSNKTDAIVVKLSGNKYTLKSLIYKYINLYGIFSYYEAIEGYFNSPKRKYVPNTDAFNNPESILNYAMSTMENIGVGNRQLEFVWKWKNQRIVISCTSSNCIRIEFVNH